MVLDRKASRRFSKKEGFGNALRAGGNKGQTAGRQEAEEEPGGMFRGMGEEGCAGTTLPSSWLGQKENEGSSRETWERGRFYFLIRDRTLNCLNDEEKGGIEYEKLHNSRKIT